MPSAPNADPLISVVVPTRNRAHLLPALLDALAAQTYAHYEVIVVDDASTDATPDLLQRWAGPDRVALCQETPAGSYAARNRGWHAAHGEIIAFTDDDCRPHPGWLAALATALAGDVLGAQGMTVAKPGEITPFTHQVDQRTPGPPYRTCNIAYRREVLERAGGFDDALRWYADNIFGLTVARQGRIAWAPAAVVEHPPRPKEWRTREDWRARFAADAKHRRFLREQGLEPPIPDGLLPLVLWVARPLRDQSLTHLRFLLRRPRAYLAGLPALIADKWELFAALRARRQPEPKRLPPLAPTSTVSAVVVSRGRTELRDTLAALRGQTHPPDEIVLALHDAPIPPDLPDGIRVLALPPSTLGEARRRAVEAASGDILAFTDDDCLPAPGWVAAALAAWQRRPDLLGVRGPTIAEAGPVSGHAVSAPRPDSLYRTCNIAYRRDAILAAGNFDPAFIGWFEDAALGASVSRLGPIGWEPAMLVRHRVMPRQPLDRAGWQRLLADERRLATIYRSFYWRTRGPGFLPTVIARWLLGSPLKTLLRASPTARQDPRGFLALLSVLIRERTALLSALLQPSSMS